MLPRSRKEQIEEMLRGEPNDPELRYMLAMEFASTGDDLAAANCFKELMDICPDYPPGFHQGARTLVRLNRIDEARSVLRQGIPAALRQNNAHAAGEMEELLNSLD